MTFPSELRAASIGLTIARGMTLKIRLEEVAPFATPFGGNPSTGIVVAK